MTKKTSIYSDKDLCYNPNLAEQLTVQDLEDMVDSEADVNPTWEEYNKIYK